MLLLPQGEDRAQIDDPALSQTQLLTLASHAVSAFFTESAFLPENSVSPVTASDRSYFII